MYRRKIGPMQYTEGGSGGEDAFLLALMTHLTSQVWFDLVVLRLYVNS